LSADKEVGQVQLRWMSNKRGKKQDTSIAIRVDGPVDDRDMIAKKKKSATRHNEKDAKGIDVRM
jgi:hypothetical protein